MAEEKDLKKDGAKDTAAEGEKPVKGDKKGAPAKEAAGKETAGKKPAKTKGKKKAKRRLLTDGRAYIQASFNNTIITITDPNGEVVASASAGSSGFKGPRKATPYAAQVAAEAAVTKAKVFGLEKVHVYIKGAGNGREQAIRGLQAGGVAIESLTDVTPVPHNGCRPRKSRRV